MNLSNPFLLWVQLTVAAIGCVIGFLSLHEAILDFRVLRQRGLNSVREILTRADVFDESGRLIIHLVIIWATVTRMLDVTSASLWYNRLALILVTVIVALSSWNSLKMRRDVLRTIEGKSEGSTPEAGNASGPPAPVININNPASVQVIHSASADGSLKDMAQDAKETAKNTKDTAENTTRSVAEVKDAVDQLKEKA